jgi:prepilin-type N-terminal cleavage/methylation domain-containing protein
MNRRGYSVIELLVVMTIVGILANIALPAIQQSKKRAEAAAVLADVHTIRLALLDYYASVNNFPRTGRWGTIPRNLENSLPAGFVFDDGAVRYRWRRFDQRRRQRTGRLGTIQIRSSDRELMRRIKMLYNGAVTGNARTMSMIIE